MKLLSSEKLADRIEKYWLHTGDDGKDRITVESIQDVQPILESNKRQYNDASEKYGKGSFHKVASIPTIVIEDMCRTRNIPYSELMQCKTDRAQGIWNELLNQREFRAFRTRPGHVKVKK